MTIARLGLDIDSAPAVQGARDIGLIVPAALRAERAVDSLASGATQDLRRVQTASAQTGASVNSISRGFASLGRGQIQNVAFQVGDFATQVGAGTRASVALGQQLPQLLGGFGAIGAVLGAGVAIGVPALAAAFRALGSATVDLAEVTDDMRSSADDFFSLIENRSKAIDGLTARLGGAAGAARLFTDTQIAVAQGLAQADINQAVNALREFVDLGTEFDEFGAKAQVNIQGLENLADTLGITKQRAVELTAEAEALANARGAAEQAAAFEALLAEMVRVGIEFGDLTEEGQQFVQALIDGGTAAGILAANAGVVAGNTEVATVAASALADEWIRAAGAAVAAMNAGREAERERKANALEASRAVGADAAMRASGNRAAPGTFATGAAAVGYETYDAGSIDLGGFDTFGYGTAPKATVSGSRGGGGGVSRSPDDEIITAKKNAWDEYYREMDDMREQELDRIAAVNDRAAQSFADMFSGAITGAKSLRESLADLLGELGNLAINNAFQQLFTSSGFGGSALGSVVSSVFGIGGVPSYSGGTDFHPGGLARINEQGGEIVDLPRGSRVIPRDLSEAMAGNGGSKTANININVSGARGNAEISEMVAAGVNRGLAQVREVFADSVVRVNGDPRMRGAF